MKLQNTELLNTQTSAEQQDSNQSSQLIERETLDGTPFEIVTTEEGTFVALGSYRLTEFMSKEDAKEKIQKKHWDLIISVNLALGHAQKKFIENLANQNNNL